MTPTPSVQNALDEAVKEALSLINQWRKVNTDQDISTLNPYAEYFSETLPETGMKTPS
jgi:hypothetical protein